MTPDITLPEVQALHQKARFYRENDTDYVEISYVGSKDTLVKKVKPEHMAKFREEWNAFCDGVPLKKREGTPLTDVPGINEQLAEKYIGQNVHNAEELAALNDAQCQALGHGTLTLRKSSREMLGVRQFQQEEAARKKVSDAAATIGPVPAEKYASQSDLEELRHGMANLSQNVAALVQALAAKKPGRPKKNAEE